MSFSNLFELLDYIYLVYLSFPELDRDFVQICEKIEYQIEYPDGIEGVLNDLYQLMGEQYESDFYDETPEALQLYYENFNKMADILNNFIMHFQEQPYDLNPIPNEGERIFHSWKRYIRNLGHELEQNKYIGGIHPQNLYYIILYISNHIREYNFSTNIKEKLILIEQAFEDYRNPYSPNAGNYKTKIQELIEEQQKPPEKINDIVEKIISKAQNHQTLMIVEKFLLRMTNNSAILKLIENLFPKDHEIISLTQKTIKISDINTSILWL